MAKKLSKEEFEKKAKEIHGDKYDYSKVNYKNTETKVKIICLIHGVFEQTPNNHIYQKCGCPTCKKEKLQKEEAFSTKQFIKKAKEIHQNKYDYSKVDYKNAYTKIKIICPIHGVFEQIPANHIYQKCGCPTCKKEKIKYNFAKAYGEKKSLGEKEIKTILLEKELFFEREYKFEDCRDVLPLPFDFYVPSKNLLIEYNGKQHYEPIRHWGGRKKFLKQKHHDWLKRRYAKRNNIDLLVISYKESIEEKLCLKLNLTT